VSGVKRSVSYIGRTWTSQQKTRTAAANSAKHNASTHGMAHPTSLLYVYHIMLNNALSWCRAWTKKRKPIIPACHSRHLWPSARSA